MLYPIGTQTFEKIIKRNNLYVDKTDLVYELAQKHVCFLSRPRMFGKSLLISTLDAYFSGRKDLFQGLKIETLEKNWDVHPVFRIDFSNIKFSEPDSLNHFIENCLVKWEKKYKVETIYSSLGMRFNNILEAAKKQTGHRAVVLIDDYDKPLLAVLGTELEEKTKNTLMGFYNIFKSADEYLRFVFVTGVTKFSQMSVFSGFNHREDISNDRRFEAICGITDVEMQEYFAETIEDMASKYNCDVDQMKLRLKKQYGGYHFSAEMLDVYNPFSLINAFAQKRLDNYWYQSIDHTYFINLLSKHRVNIQEMLSYRYLPRNFWNYFEDYESPVAMLCQSGYLTITECVRRNICSSSNLYKLNFPNNEIVSRFLIQVAKEYFNRKEIDIFCFVNNIEHMLRACDLDGVRDAFTAFLASIPYEANKDERAKDFETHFSYTFYIINRLLGCVSTITTLIEKQNSKGRADIIIETDNDIFIFEFKLDKSAKEALEQIEEMQYAVPYLDNKRKVHKIGVNISSQTRTVEQWLVS